MIENIAESIDTLNRDDSNSLINHGLTKKQNYNLMRKNSHKSSIFADKANAHNGIQIEEIVEKSKSENAETYSDIWSNID